MNRSLVLNCLPVLALSLALSACGNKQATSRGGAAATELSSDNINLSMEADCGADIPGATTSTNADVTSCHLTPAQKALLSDVGPFAVQVAQGAQSIRIVKKDHADEIAGEGPLAEDGTFSIPLTVGARFSELEQCPVKLEGIATGKVTLDADKKVVAIDLNTAFNFANVPTAGSGLAFAEPAPTDPAAPAPAQPAPSNPDRDRDDHDRDHDRDNRGGKGGQEKGGPVVTPPKGGQDKGGPVVTPPKGGQDKGGPVVTPPKGGQDKGGKGGQEKGGQGPRVPGQRIDSCVSFSPCAFATSGTMSCSR